MIFELSGTITARVELLSSGDIQIAGFDANTVRLHLEERRTDAQWTPLELRKAMRRFAESTGASLHDRNPPTEGDVRLV